MKWSKGNKQTLSYYRMKLKTLIHLNNYARSVAYEHHKEHRQSKHNKEWRKNWINQLINLKENK